MKTLFTVILMVMAISFSFISISFAEGRGVHGFHIADAKNTIYQSGRAAMKDAGFNFKGYSLQNFWIEKRLKRVDIDGDGNMYDGMSFIVVTIWLQPNTPMIKAQKMLLYLAVAEKNGILYFATTSEILKPGDNEFSNYIEGTEDHYFKEDLIEEIQAQRE